MKNCPERMWRLPFFLWENRGFSIDSPRFSIYNQPPKSFAELKEDDHGMG
jgi:hypothetical protein